MCEQMCDMCEQLCDMYDTFDIGCNMCEQTRDCAFVRQPHDTRECELMCKHTHIFFLMGHSDQHYRRGKLILSSVLSHGP